MHEIRSISIVQSAKALGFVYGAFGIILGVIAFLVALARGHFLRAILAILFLPIIYGIAAFLVFLLLFWIYNQVAARVGGIRFEMD
jgi:hypothetical protein